MSTFFYMLLAFVVGVLVGWFIWGRLRGELDSLRGDLDRTRGERDRLRADSDRLKGELDASGRARADLESRLRDTPSAKAGADKAATPAPAALMSTTSATAKARPTKPAAAKKPAAMKTAAAPKPAAKAAAPKKAAAPAAKKAAAPQAKSGKADNLRRLIGIGQGVTTYAQIAAWTAADVKRIEEVLNFDGRIAREKWIEQAKLLAAGDEAEFARQFPTAGTANNT
ncbi:proton-conducting membrane transporter [Mesorhizobium sp. B1-1-5]|uniref:proton-conducting membrane transporter n=1 Tax=Mesorhizobium sp. B1-1-5 TaxID=2589979 RepID=UPI001129803A|nr:proton-conducting membrane transporter [Mesorhizobium sp. B1-1-5]TPO08887.1 proton-conducting membrane transporter [Mesorhizobium sp. B1-1-5]